MSAEMRCEDVRELAPELALEIAIGEERDVALRHLRDCPGCRRLVAELSTVGDELLLLAPSHEPPLGFESRVLEALGESREPARRERPPVRRRWLVTAAATAALVLGAALGAVSVFVASVDERRLAESYLAVLSEGQGSFFAAAALQASEGRAGTVFGYEGRPSWIVITLEPPLEEERVFRVEARTQDGRYLDLGDAALGGEVRVWGGRIPVELSTVLDVRVVASDGGEMLVATFDPSATPWD